MKNVTNQHHHAIELGETWLIRVLPVGVLLTGMQISGGVIDDTGGRRSGLAACKSPVGGMALLCLPAAIL